MKKILSLALLLGATSAFSQSEMDEMKKQILELQKKTGGQHLSFKVDYRVTADQLEYTKADGSTVGNDLLLSNRLILNMGHKYNDNLVFKGSLAYNKMFGDTANHDQRNGSTYSDFDWVINENPYDNQIRVREAYFLYTNSSFLGWDKLPWSFSLGRRPSTNGFLGNHREGFEEPQSPLAHSINVEFDGLSWKFDLDKLTGVSGMDFKICAGRGLTNATSRFQMAGTDYAHDNTKSGPIDMIGFIFTPYNNGQYNIKAQVYHANNLIGFDQQTLQYFMTNGNSGSDNGLQDHGELNNATLSMEINGIGNMINDYMDGIKLFGSYSMSQTDPNKNMYMLGSDKKETGSSYWFGASLPGFFKDGESFGFEYNHGSKYWRSFTYGEDTLIGSKLAARGSAYEAYYNLPLIDTALTFQIRYTYIKYDYTGSNNFFGADGTPMKMAEAQANMQNPVEKAQALRATLRYNF